MQATFRTTLFDANQMRAKNVRVTLDTDKWLERVHRDELGLYGNVGELMEEHLLPLLYRDDKLAELYVLSLDMYMHTKERNHVLIFEFAMFVWAAYRAGRVSKEVWSSVLAVAWQSGSRGMMACVVLTPATVIEMFKSASMDVIHELAAYEAENLQAKYAALPDEFVAYRGVSTGIDHYETGFSWTVDPREPLRFAGLNCHTKKEIPGIVTATVRKEAVLAMFSFEGEVVLDPTVPKVNVTRHFLRGAELRDFHKNFDVEANTRNVLTNNQFARKAYA